MTDQDIKKYGDKALLSFKSSDYYKKSQKDRPLSGADSLFSSLIPFRGLWKMGNDVYERGRKKLLPKADKGIKAKSPNIWRVVKNLWNGENRFQRGYNESNNKYYPYESSPGVLEIGPGIDLSQRSQMEEWAKNGRTQDEIEEYIYNNLSNELPNIDRAFRNRGNGRPDTISPQLKEGMLDMYWQIGNNIYQYNDLMKAISNGDLKRIQEESKTYFVPQPGVKYSETETKNGKVLDRTRWIRRLLNYMHY